SRSRPSRRHKASVEAAQGLAPSLRRLARRTAASARSADRATAEDRTRFLASTALDRAPVSERDPSGDTVPCSDFTISSGGGGIRTLVGPKWPETVFEIFNGLLDHGLRPT